MNQIIKPTAINFSEILKNSTTTLQLSESTQSKLIDLLNEEFNEEQQHLYVANLWMYMNYHPTNDYPINLETIFHMIGFANKGNAKRTLENNFTIDEDYKIIATKKTYSKKAASPNGEAVQSSNKLGGSGLNEETIMLNIDTFKSMCMIAKTPQGKEMRKYYVKLENINHKLIIEELKEKNLLLIEQAEIYSKEKEQIWKQSFRNKYVVYLIIISENLIKYGFTKDFDDRFTTHKTNYGKNIKIAFIIESKNNELLESLFENHERIKPNRISQVFNGKNKTELIKLNKDLTLKNVINLLTETNKIIDIIIETQVLKKYNVDILNSPKNIENNVQDDLKEMKDSIKKLNKKENIKKKKVKSKAQLDKDEQNKEIIKEYFENFTIFSSCSSDTIKMSDLYNKFTEWIKIKYPIFCIPSSSNSFTRLFNKFEIGNYEEKISNLNGNSGIMNRKFKN